MASGSLETLQQPNRRVERLQMWVSAVDDKTLGTVLELLGPGVDVAGAVVSPC